jgi:predicted secreted Zn-dependent protease
MGRQKPKSLPHDALTQWNVTWTYAWRNVEGGVILQNPKVSVSISTTLPRWTPSKDASPELVARWRTYMHALVLHENSHGAIAIQAGRDIERQLLALPHQPSADALKQLVESTGQQVLKEARDKENRFDEQTQHGMKQGARFP